MMSYRSLGRTCLSVSRLAFGAGPVSGLLTGNDQELQQRTVARAIECGINWFDTAAGYGQGRSEQNLGRALRKLNPRIPIHIATKVRLHPDRLHDIRTDILESVEQSLQRLQVPAVTLLQLHNGITKTPGDQPFSISPTEIFRPEGVISVFRELQRQGLVQAIGLTGTGDPESMRQAIQSDEFDTVQLPYNILNPSAGRSMPPEFNEQNYGNILEDCQQRNLGVFAIRVFAGGAIYGAPASSHTKSTPFFPLDLYERDLQHSEDLRQPESQQQAGEIALSFALAHPAIHSAIIGFGMESHVDDAIQYLNGGRPV